MKRFYLAEILNIPLNLISKVFIYSDFESKRLQYTLELIFEQLLGISFSFVDDPNISHLVYSKNNSSINSVNIAVCSEILNNTGFEPININYKNSGKNTILFINEKDKNEQWDFDLFSAVFYLVSRYEEYKGFTPDSHNRFPPEASILYKTSSFEYPLVNIWVQKLKNELLSKFPELEFKEPEFRFISTIDVDSTYRFKGKGVIRTIAGFFNDLKNFNFNDIVERLKTITGLKPDSFDVFERISKLHKKYGTEVIYFWLVGNYGKFDKNINPKNQKQRTLINEISKEYKVGIHPSYQSNFEKNLVLIEKYRLEQICNSKIELSRQHFLVHQFPETFQNLIKAGIKSDFTLGYTSHYGFRAAIASPFYFYDLSNENYTKLLLYPFCSMDITPMFYFKFSINQAIEKNRELLKKVKEVNGIFISLWHNESISGTMRWQGGWHNVYEHLLKDASEI